MDHLRISYTLMALLNSLWKFAQTLVFQPTVFEITALFVKQLSFFLFHFVIIAESEIGTLP
jgi:hypothetical protein